MPASLQNIDEAFEIGVRIGVRILQRVSDTGLGSQMHDNRKPKLFERRLHSRSVGKIELQKPKCGILLEKVKARQLERRIVVVVEIVETDDRLAGFQQTPCEMKADEPRATRDEQTV